MSRLKDRIKRLEVQVFGDEDAAAGCTMEELMEAYRFLAPERSKLAAADPSNPGCNLQRNRETSVPPVSAGSCGNFTGSWNNAGNRRQGSPEPHPFTPVRTSTWSAFAALAPNAWAAKTIPPQGAQNLNVRL